MTQPSLFDLGVLIMPDPPAPSSAPEPPPPKPKPKRRPRQARLDGVPRCGFCGAGDWERMYRRHYRCRGCGGGFVFSDDDNKQWKAITGR